MQAPTLRDVYEAKKTIAPYLPRTPLHFSPGLSDFLDAQVYLKHDEYLPLGAFKARGGVNLLAHLSDEERGRGVITASTGNHGQSIAYACGLFGARALIVLPEEANPVKVAAMRALGAELIFHGQNFDEAKDYCERLAAEEGYRYAHPANEPLLIAGVATQTLEVIEDLPDVEVDALTDGSLDAGLSWRPAYLGVRVSGVPQQRDGEHAGSFPQSFVDVMDRLGTAAFWYSSGGTTDAFKVPLPVSVGVGGAEPETPVDTPQTPAPGPAGPQGCRDAA